MKVKPKRSTLSHLVEATGCLGEEVTYCDGCFLASEASCVGRSQANSWGLASRLLGGPPCAH